MSEDVQTMLEQVRDKVTEVVKTCAQDADAAVSIVNNYADVVVTVDTRGASKREIHEMHARIAQVLAPRFRCVSVVMMR